MAEPAFSTIVLSSLFDDPALKAFFERAERDNGPALVIDDPEPTLTGGEAVELELA